MAKTMTTEDSCTMAVALMEKYLRDDSIRKETPPSPDKVVAYRHDKGYFAIQESNEGYDYSFYDNNTHLLDGGVYDNLDISIIEAAKDILSDVEIEWISCQRIDYDELMEQVELMEKQGLED